jgi:hypothetical protein
MWWEAEMKWRLARTGLTIQSAKDLWERVRVKYASYLTLEAEALRNSVEFSNPKQGTLLNF